MDSGASVHGIGYFRKSDLTDFLVSVAGSKVYKSDSLDGTMDDITNSLTITAGQDKIWTMATMNNIVIGVGGNPNAPFKYTGTGNAAALGGTPPNGSFGLTLNNYFFIGNTTSNPSRIYWSVLGNPEDWSSAGSGSQDVSANDGDTLIGAAPLGNDRLLLFKQNSIHELLARNPPFPVLPKFKGVGAASKTAIVNVGDIIYFITPEPRMKATDGFRIIDFPDFIDPTFDNLNKNRLAYIQGLYYPRLRQIWWICSDGSSSTNNVCIVWDLDRKSWLRHTSGFGMNCVCLAKDRTPYGGAYAGKIYKMDDVSATNDASESNSAIDGYWKTGWIDLGDMIKKKSFPYITVNNASQTYGNYEFSYSFDFVPSYKSFSINMKSPGMTWDIDKWDSGAWGSVTDMTTLQFMKGQGRFVQFTIRNRNDYQKFGFNGFEIPVKEGSPSK
jgi:hypothetical protein